MSALLSALAEILFVVFILGIVGSFVVIVVTFIEDLDLFLGDKESSDEVG